MKDPSAFSSWLDTTQARSGSKQSVGWGEAEVSIHYQRSCRRLRDPAAEFQLLEKPFKYLVESILSCL